MRRQYFVYFLASKPRVLHTGVTGDLPRRVHQHRSHAIAGFTARYHVTRLVHCEETNDINAAIAPEKQIKGWLRSRKIALIEKDNPFWKDLAEGWFG